MASKEITRIDEITIHLERSEILLSGSKTLSKPRDVAALARKIINAEEIEAREKIIALYFNRRNDLIGYCIIGIGGVAGVSADIKIILGIAVKTLSSGIILAHNHPSGNVNSSEQDEVLTNNLKKAAEYHDIKLLDHIIVTKDDYTSLSNEGLMGISNTYPLIEDEQQIKAIELIEDEPLQGIDSNISEIEKLTKELKNYIDENTKL